MSVAVLQVAGDGEAGPEHGDGPEVTEAQPARGVNTEDLHTGEARDCRPHQEAEDVGELGDGERHRGVRVGQGHPRYQIPAGLLGPGPGGEQQEDPVHPDANHEEDHHHVDSLPGVTKIQTHPEA